MRGLAYDRYFPHINDRGIGWLERYCRSYDPGMVRHFSKRHGYGAANAEITVREDAPDDLRYAVAEIARSAGMATKLVG